MIRLISAFIFSLVFSQLCPMAPMAYAMAKQNGCAPRLRTHGNQRERSGGQFLESGDRDSRMDYEGSEVSIFQNDSSPHAAFEDQPSAESRDYSPAFE